MMAAAYHCKQEMKVQKSAEGYFSFLITRRTYKSKWTSQQAAAVGSIHCLWLCTTAAGTSIMP